MKLIGFITLTHDCIKPNLIFTIFTENNYQFPNDIIVSIFMIICFLRICNYVKINDPKRAL